MKKINLTIEGYLFELEIDDSDKVRRATFNFSNCLPSSLSVPKMKKSIEIRSDIFEGKWDWLIKKERVIELPTHGIKITVTGVQYDGSVRFSQGTIEDDLKIICEHCSNSLCDFDCFEAKEWATSNDKDITQANIEELESNRNYNYACDAILSIVMAHAIAGVNVESPAYLEGLESAIDAISNSI